MAKEYDPKVHTAEHVLNQAMIRLFGTSRCFSSHLNARKSKCDYRFERNLTDAEAAVLEDEVNAVLQRKLPVIERYLARAAAEKIVDLGKLPGSVGPETPIRLVSVGGYDMCACIGAHVADTGAVGRFNLVSRDFMPEKQVLRLRFTVE